MQRSRGWLPGLMDAMPVTSHKNILRKIGLQVKDFFIFFAKKSTKISIP